MSKSNDFLSETVEKRISTPMGVKKVNVPKDLQTREDKMKKFFEGMEEPKNVNPNIQKKSEMEAGFFKQISKMIDLDTMWNGLLAYNPVFESERVVIDYLIDVRTKMQYASTGMFLLGFGALAKFGPVQMDTRLKIMGFTFSCMLGVIFAKLKTNVYSVEVISK